MILPLLPSWLYLRELLAGSLIVALRDLFSFLGEFLHVVSPLAVYPSLYPPFLPPRHTHTFLRMHSPGSLCLADSCFSYKLQSKGDFLNRWQFLLYFSISVIILIYCVFSRLGSLRAGNLSFLTTSVPQCLAASRLSKILNQLDKDHK